VASRTTRDNATGGTEAQPARYKSRSPRRFILYMSRLTMTPERWVCRDTGIPHSDFKSTTREARRGGGKCILKGGRDSHTPRHIPPVACTKCPDRVLDRAPVRRLTRPRPPQWSGSAVHARKHARATALHEWSTRVGWRKARTVTKLSEVPLAAVSFHSKHLHDRVEYEPCINLEAISHVKYICIYRRYTVLFIGIRYAV